MNLIDDLARFQAAGWDEEDELAALTSMLSAIKGSDLSAIAFSILSDDARLRAATKFAYRHVNGFSKVTLLRTDSLCLRVHVWNGVEAPAENIHSHKWTFASRVLAGTVRESLYEVAPEAENLTATEYQYDKPKNEATGFLRPIRDVRLSEVGQLDHEESSLYTSTTTDIHRVHSTEQPHGDLITLVLTGRSRTPASSVFANRGEKPVADRADAGLNRAETIELLTFIQSLAQ